MIDSINACVKYWLGYIFPKTCKEEKVVANKNVFFNLDLFFFNHTYGQFFSDVVGSIARVVVCRSSAQLQHI